MIMDKINKDMLNKLDGRIDKFGVELDNFIYKVVTPKKEQMEEVKNTLNDVKKKYDDIVINGIDDTVTFLETKENISKLEGMLEKSVMEYDDVLKLQEEFEEIQHDKLYNDFLKYGCDNSVKREFDSNMLLLQKQMFKKFLEIEKICNQMEELEQEYKGVIRYVKHPKTQYVGIDSTPFINKVHQRFNIKNTVGYYTGITSDKYDFEF